MPWGEGFEDVEISLQSDHHHDVEAAREGNLGQGEDVGSNARLDLKSVLRGEIRETIEQQHSNLVRTNQNSGVRNHPYQQGSVIE